MNLLIRKSDSEEVDVEVGLQDDEIIRLFR